MLDQTDLEILKLLEQNSRMQWREIGEQVHLTGPAVANRVQSMEKLGIIEGFTVQINQHLLPKQVTAFATVFMKSNEHQEFVQFCKNDSLIQRAHRISGDGCYWIEIAASSSEELDSILDQILKHGNYKLQMSINQIK